MLSDTRWREETGGHQWGRNLDLVLWRVRQFTTGSPFEPSTLGSLESEIHESQETFRPKGDDSFICYDNGLFYIWRTHCRSSAELEKGGRHKYEGEGTWYNPSLLDDWFGVSWWVLRKVGNGT